MAVSHTYVVGLNGVVKRRDDHLDGWLDVSPFSFIDWDINDVMTDPYNPDKVFIVGEKVSIQGFLTGIMVSLDAGMTWSVPGGTWSQGSYFHEVFVVSPNIIWAIGNGGVAVRSLDGGLTFNITNDLVGGTIPFTHSSTIHAISDLVAVVAASPSDDPDVNTVLVYLTINGGNTWTELNSGNSLINTVTIPVGPAGGIWISEDMQKIIVTCGYIQFLSENAGLTFPARAVQIPRSGKHLTWYPTYGTPTQYNHTGGIANNFNQSVNGIAWANIRNVTGYNIYGAHLYDSVNGYFTNNNVIFSTSDAYLTDTSLLITDYSLRAVWSGKRSRGYMLTDCSSENNTIYSDSPVLEAYLDSIVKVEIEGVASTTCWLVTLWTTFPIVDTEITSVIADYINCETCLEIVPDGLGIPCKITKRVGEPGFTTKHCDPDYVIALKCSYADAVYDLYLKMQYGINICCERDLPKIKLKHRLLELGEIYDPEACPCTPCVVCCLAATDVNITETII
jgi:hypothetical protein